MSKRPKLATKPVRSPSLPTSLVNVSTTASTSISTTFYGNVAKQQAVMPQGAESSSSIQTSKSFDPVILFSLVFSGIILAIVIMIGIFYCVYLFMFRNATVIDDADFSSRSDSSKRSSSRRRRSRRDHRKRPRDREAPAVVSASDIYGTHHDSPPQAEAIDSYQSTVIPPPRKEQSPLIRIDSDDLTQNTIQSIASKLRPTPSTMQTLLETKPSRSSAPVFIGKSKRGVP